MKTTNRFPILVIALLAWAQCVLAQTQMRINFTDGRSMDCAVSDVAEILFLESEYYDFEDYRIDALEKFYEWHVGNHHFTDGMWKTNNPGFKLCRPTALPLEYPCVPMAGEGLKGGACVKLETVSTGTFGAMMNMRMAAGCIYNGLFDVSNYLKNYNRATLFGSPFTHKPDKLTAWLRYEPGEKFLDKDGKQMEGITDEPEAFVILYRNVDEAGDNVVLDGSNIFSSPYIVGIGRLPHCTDIDGMDSFTGSPVHGITSEWKQVEIPIVYTKPVDEQLLANHGYNLAIGFSSSWKGMSMQGAVGSKLYLDSVTLCFQ